jgi:3-hydroxymyristoyl/3-hydroxydecanoyl-(acyl carrier protein) dehydratase
VSPKAQNASQTAPQASQLAEQSQDHAEFLKKRQQAWQNLKTSLRQRLAEQTASTPTPAPAPVGAVEVVSPPAVSPGYDHGFTENYSQPETVIWDEADLLEFAEGKIANVFGPEYSVIDSYSRQVRLPMPPYLLVSRVTALDATRDAYRRSYIQTEYDIPLDAWYAIDGQTPLAVAIESGQCDLLLISYIGIDFQAKGVRVYRLLDCTLTFMDELPKVGETLRYDIWINSFAQSGDNLLFFFNYECFIGDKLVLKMDGGCAGFFTDEELDRGKGIIFTEKEKAARAQIERQFFTPPLRCEQTQFSQEELFLICEGRIAECFGPQYGQAPGVNRSLRFPDPGFMMLDEVTSLDPQGGPWGLGLVEGRKFLAPDDWYFPCHFKDDEVLAGSLMAQGCAQLLQFYMLYLGLHSYTVDARFQAVQDLPQVVRCRGQVTPTHEDMIYQMEVKAISLRPRPTVVANVAIMFKGKMIVLFEDLAFELREKDPKNELAPAQVMELAPPPPAQHTDAGPPAFDEADIDNFALGSIEACFGPEFAIYNTLRAPRTPNGYLQLISRVQETVGRLREFIPGSYVSTETDLPSEAWFGEDNNHPAVMPYSVYMELGLQPCGFLSAFLGSSMIYQDTGLYFRNLDGDGIILKDGDWRGKTLTNKATLVSSTAFNHTVLQKFEFELGYQGEPVYKGSASFGYFTKQALADQLGLDRGQKLPAWLAKEGSQWPQERINLRSASDRRRFYVAPADKPFYKLADNRLDLLDEVVVVPGGGSAGEGYIYAEAEVIPETWFFTNHFHEDPVMPGSLGVEAIMQAMQAYALHQNLGAEFNSPRFAQVSGHKIVWKYRGQIVRESETMSLDFHLTRLERQPSRLILIGQANLWRDGLRIYEVSEVALAIEETA